MIEDASKIKIVPDFLTDEDCDFAINFIDKNKELGMTHLVPTGRHLLTTTQDPEAHKFLKKYCKKAFLEYCGTETPEGLYVSDFMFVMYESGGSMYLHMDNGPDFGNTVFTLVMYFNDDFVGGAVRFPNLDVTVDPVRRLAVIFPGTYMHEVLEVTSGKRYIVNVGFTDEQRCAIYSDLETE